MQQRFYEINGWWKKTDNMYEFYDDNINTKMESSIMQNTTAWTKSISVIRCKIIIKLKSFLCILTQQTKIQDYTSKKFDYVLWLIWQLILRLTILIFGKLFVWERAKSLKIHFSYSNAMNAWIVKKKIFFFKIFHLFLSIVDLDLFE